MERGASKTWDSDQVQSVSFQANAAREMERRTDELEKPENPETVSTRLALSAVLEIGIGNLTRLQASVRPAQPASSLLPDPLFTSAEYVVSETGLNRRKCSEPRSVR